MEQDPKTTVRELAEELEVSPTTVSTHLKSIGKVKKLDKWIPHELKEEHMRRRMEICLSLLQRERTDGFLDRVLTCDEKWVRYDNRKRSAQRVNKHDPPAPRPQTDAKTETSCSQDFAYSLVDYSRSGALQLPTKRSDSHFGVLPS